MDIMQRNLETELKSWKDSHLRMPLLLRGARQVGKTFLIEKFGKSEFEIFASVNFEAQPEAAACFETLDPEQILIRLEKILKMQIIPGKTLLFLDEIQACPKAILSMRYFKEKMPKLHLIGAGSLLEFTLMEGKFSFPVGRIQFLYLKPLSFYEFALALGKSSYLDVITGSSLETPCSPEIHDEMLKLVRLYFLIGGMPAVVSAYTDSLSFVDCRSIQDILISTYRADFSKYASDAEQKYLRILFDTLPQILGEQIKYSKIDPSIRAREFKNALDQLEWAGLIKSIQASSAAGVPLAAQLKRSHFKTLFLDIGLAQRALQIEPEVFLTHELTQINKGALAEQFVGQELVANSNPKSDEMLFFWQREKRGSEAEVDYLTVVKGHVLPIEVKAGPRGKLKSLYQFMEEKKSPLGVRISEKSLSFENGIISIPFYMINQLERIASELFNRYIF
jgi:uncharacterized protein